METCELCLSPATLCQSHIIPEFCYKSIYDAKHRAVVVNPTDPSDQGYAQKGARSKILCQGCERLINDRYEKAFKAYWYDGDALAPFRAGKEAQWLHDIDYSSFKLFHLSVLFRASVSNHPNYHEVDLGPHEDCIRQMVLEQDPREDWRYAVMCSAVEGPGGVVWDQLVGVARRIKQAGHWGYNFTFAGAQWIYLVASHPQKEFENLRLTEQGRLPVAKLPWLEMKHPDHF